VDFGWEKAQKLLSLIEQLEDLADVKPLIHLMTTESPSCDDVKTLKLKASHHESSEANSRRRESDLP
jgi:hypothetical protein